MPKPADTCSSCRLNPKESIKCSFTLKDWSRLRASAKKFLSLKKTLNSYSTQLDQILSEDSTYRDYASQIQNSTVKVILLQKRTEILRASIQSLNLKINSLEKEKIDENEQKLFLTRQIETFVSREKDLINDRKKLKRLQNELLFRLHFLLHELSMYQLNTRLDIIKYIKIFFFFAGKSPQILSTNLFNY